MDQRRDDIAAVKTAGPRWQIGVWQSGPCPHPPGLADFALAIMQAAGATLLLGLGAFAIGSVLAKIAEAPGSALAILGIVTAVSSLGSLVGHFLGAFLLWFFARRGACGWMMVALSGALVGGICAQAFGLSLAFWLGPPLALLQLYFLKREIDRGARRAALRDSSL